MSDSTPANSNPGVSSASASPSAAASVSSGNGGGGAGSSGGQRGARTWSDVAAASGKRSDIAVGLWMRCPTCEAMLFRKRVEENLHVCPECEHHFRLSAAQRVGQLCDPGGFESLFEQVEPVDALGFVDQKPYPERLAAAVSKTGRKDAVICGHGHIKGRRAAVACMDFSFMGGSMGSVVGERITRTIEFATERDLPLVIVSCSGGARMQEGALSLVQMAKTSAALARLDEAGGLYISVLTDPTTGGVSASFAMLGDVILAEPKALIGFSGPRVIANTIRQQLPEGFQTAEHLLAKGFVDRVVSRAQLRNEIARLIDYAGK